ncbi:type I restriction endonuclease subunit R [Butyricimonas synergistica]|uniref:type I restriction endonuclease subunit R n=1 Tax=Butyricimonas synergistica TaxID=544644 RepID=UPI0022E5B24A|nr:type I restriction endonuclease [Butyricimonas synergistica]
MVTDTSEKNLEIILVSYLCDSQGYEKGFSEDYNKNYALDTERVKRFILSTQKKKAENTACFVSEVSERKFFAELNKQLASRGITDVLRKGFRYISELFDMYYPLPSELNPTAQEMYAKNIFCVTRQLFYSKDNSNSIDVMVSLNGMPVMTMELKNHYTNQTVENAIRQYQTDRDASDPLLAPKRCAVHFAVDDDNIRMCTWLCGKSSWFLPFDKGANGGAGNPVNPNGLRTSYLWEDILKKESLSDILENYAQVVKKKDEKTGKEKISVVWPRYHQLEVVRQLLSETRAKGVGQRYLIQHSAGSGKSNSITWLAYQLVGLLDGTEPLMDSVIVVTDRVNLDKQIRDNIASFKRLSNLVAWADSAETLRKNLESGKKIIITIVHKFPFILETIGSEMKHKRFGIIIDEAHSSQNGSMSAKMNIALSGNVGEDGEDLEDKLNAIIEGRKMVKNANYYAFTATPKNKTLQMFGTAFEQPDGEIGHRPFHEYTMKQAIEEGFIMDVLKHYTTYNSYYKIVKAIESDPEFEKKQAQKKLRAFVESQPETIQQKASIIVEHFHSQIIDKGKMGGQARAMVVTSSILRAIEFYYEISHLLEERKSPYKAIVAFSGSKNYGGKDLTESDVNGFPSKDIEANMERDPYRILVVAEKFQTGYDQPLLHTMYVDRVLTDVKVVQTLSRLNRCHPQKRDTFVLDFANDAESIKNSFQRFYKTTILSKETDPNKLNDLIQEIESANIYSEEDIYILNEKYWAGASREEIDPIINNSVERFKELDENIQIRCKSSIKSFLRTYPFLAAVLPFKSVEWEKLNTYFSLLIHKLPVLRGEDFTEGLIEAIDFDQYRIVKGEEQKIELENSDAEIEPTPVGTPKGKAELNMARLSEILDEFNGINWLDKEKAKQQLEELPVRLQADEAFVNAARNSDKETAQQQCNMSLMMIIARMLNENTEFCRNYLDNPDFMNFINQRVFNAAYENANK